jgi:hypothetical protein
MHNRMKNRYILFQAYGNEGVFLECRFALIQLLQYETEGICLVLYTDNPDFFKHELNGFTNVIVETISAAQIKEWRGDINFVHRVKINILQHFFSNHKGSLLYCDTDSYCLGSLSSLFDDIDNNAIYMHCNEGYINASGNILMRKWHRFLTGKKTTAHQLLISNIENISMWNAGIIGMNSSYAPLLEQVLMLTDRIYPLFPKHTVEQFSFSYIFQTKATISAAENLIYHYWDLKEYRLLLQEFFADNEELPIEIKAQKIKAFLPAQIFNEKMKYKNLSFLKRLSAKKWSIKDYTELLKNNAIT